MMAVPSVVHTHHLHFRPRFLKLASKIGNRSGIAKASPGIILHKQSLQTLIPVLNDIAFRNYGEVI
jgi:hypothetical protein